MKARSAGAIVLALALLAVAPGVTGAAASAPVVLPPQLLALEAKMALLQISSERYSRAIVASVTVTAESVSAQCTARRDCRAGRPVRRITHHKASYRISESGEVDVAKRSARLTAATSSTPVGLSVVLLGSNSYLRLPGIVPRRPWVRMHLSSTKARELFSNLFPFHGEQPAGTGANPTGPYAGLVELLGAAVGPVRLVGPADVNGQTATEFDATVRPDEAGQLGSPYAQLLVGRPGVSETVRVFLAESGLPLRVIDTVAAGTDRSSVTTETLAVNVPTNVKAPPANRTIGAARFRKLSSEKNESSSFTRMETAARLDKSK